MRELWAMANEAVPIDNKFQDPMEGVSYLVENKIFDKNTCYDPEPEDVTRILKNAVRCNTIE